MRALILTIGTRGDVQPYIALARGLMHAGHDVAICTATRFESFVTEHGVAYLPMADDLLEILDTSEGRARLEGLTNVFDFIRIAFKMIPRASRAQRTMNADAWAACEAFQPDVIVYHQKIYAAPHFAERLGIPAVLGLLIPTLVPTGAWPAIGFPNFGASALARTGNRATYRFLHTMIRLMGGTHVRRWCREHNEPVRPIRVLHTPRGRPITVLHAHSQHLVPRPPDWPTNAHITGNWVLDTTDEWTPPAHLASFLDAGEPPVAIGFGSMASGDPARTTRLVLDAVRRAGVRAVLLTGWGGLDPADIPESVCVVDQAPHDWLYPRCAAVVHHGGAGTTAASLRAGRPTVICPFFGDQPFWGARVHEAGAGPSPLMHKKLTAERLAAMIREALDTPSMRERAETIGAGMRTEHGVASAIAVLERIHTGRAERT